MVTDNFEMAIEAMSKNELKETIYKIYRDESNYKDALDKIKDLRSEIGELNASVERMGKISSYYEKGKNIAEDKLKKLLEALSTIDINPYWDGANWWSSKALYEKESVMVECPEKESSTTKYTTKSCGTIEGIFPIDLALKAAGCSCIEELRMDHDVKYLGDLSLYKVTPHPDSWLEVKKYPYCDGCKYGEFTANGPLPMMKYCIHESSCGYDGHCAECVYHEPIEEKEREKPSDFSCKHYKACKRARANMEVQTMDEISDAGTKGTSKSEQESS